MKNLLMISYPFPPNATAGAVRSERIARYMTQFDWATEVVTIKPRPDLYADETRLKKLEAAIRTHQTMNIDPWLWLKSQKASNEITKLLRNIGMELFNFPDHMLSWVPFAVHKGLQIIRGKKVNAIYTTSPPHSSHLSGLLLSWLTDKPWVADFRDPWTLNAYRKKGSISNSMLRIERALENTVLKHASAVLTNTRDNHRNLIAAFPHIDSKKIVHLPNGWEDFSEEITEQPDGHQLKIVHAGTFYPRFKPYALFYALSTWLKGKGGKQRHRLNNGDLKVILLGARDATTHNLVRDLGLEDIVEIRPWVALDEARRTMRKADFLWVTLGTGSISSTYVPSKIFEYIAAQRPILAFFPEGEAADIIRRTRTGSVFTDDSADPIIATIAEAMERKRSGGRVPYAPNRQVIYQHHVKSIVGRFVSILNALQEGVS